jgi:hypothetical protein
LPLMTSNFLYGLPHQVRELLIKERSVQVR